MKPIIDYIKENVRLNSYYSSDCYFGYFEGAPAYDRIIAEKCVVKFMGDAIVFGDKVYIISNLMTNPDVDKTIKDFSYTANDIDAMKQLLDEGIVRYYVEDFDGSFFIHEVKNRDVLRALLNLTMLSEGGLEGNVFIYSLNLPLLIYPHSDGGMGVLLVDVTDQSKILAKDFLQAFCNCSVKMHIKGVQNRGFSEGVEI